MGINISIGISPRESFRDWMSFVAELEREGASRIWLIDSQLAMKDVYAGLATAALETTHLELGTGVTNVLTRHPTVTANSIAAIAELSDGRAILGLGAGDSAVYGIGKRPSRLAEVEAAIRFFKEILGGRAANWEGKSFELGHAAPPVKVYLAVSQPRMCNLAGRLADGAIIMGPAQADLLSRQVEWVTGGIAEAGRGRSDVDIGFIATVSTAGESEAGLKDVRSWASAQARLLADVKDLPSSLTPFQAEIQKAKETYDYSQHLSTHAGHQGAVSDDLTRTLAIAGTPAECTARLTELRATGIDDFIFPLMGGGRLERLRILRDEILPAMAATGKEA